MWTNNIDIVNSSTEDFKKSDVLVYWKIVDNFQKNEFDIYIKKNGKYSEIKIDDNWKNTIIKKVPKGTEQEVLNSFYGKYEDSICSKAEYTYNPLTFKNIESEKVITRTKKKKIPLKNETSIIVWRGKGKDNLKITSMNEMKINKAGQLILPQNIVKSPYLKAAIIWLWGKVNKQGQLVLDNAMKYKDQIWKIRKAWEYLEFLNKNSTLSAKINKFEELLQNSEEYIGWREVILMDYMKNISTQIEQQGFLIQKTDTWYEVKNIKTKVISKNEWKRLVEICNKNTWNRYLDFAILYGMTKWSEWLLWKEKLVQKEIINKLLKKYSPWILQKNNIENILEPWKVDKLITELKKSVVTNKSNTQNSKELIYLLNIVKQAKKWESQLEWILDWNETSFKDLNKFKKYERVQKSLVDLWSWLDNYDANKPLSEENIGNIIKSEAFKILPFAIAASILLFIWGQGKIGGSILLATIGAMAGGWIMSRMSKKWMTTTPNSIDIKSASSFWIPTEQVSTNKKTQELYNTLVEKNNKNNDADNDSLPKIENWFVIAEILKISEIPENLQKLNKIKLEDWKDYNDEVKTIILWKGDTKSFVLNWYEWKITKKDIEAFVKFMLEEKENKDKTFADLFKSDKYIENTSFETQTIAPQKDISDLLNWVLRKEYESYTWTDAAKNKKKINDLKDKTSTDLNSVLTSIKETAKDIKNGSWKDLTNRIDTLISYVEQEFGAINDPKNKFSISYIKILNNYKKYIKAEKELEKFEGTYDENKKYFEKLTTQVDPRDSSFTRLQEILPTIEEDITDLEKIKKTISTMVSTSNPSVLEEPFKTLDEKIDKIIKDKKELKDEINGKINKKVNEKLDPSSIEMTTLDEASKLLEKNPQEFLTKVISNRDKLKEIFSDDIDLSNSAKNIEYYGKIYANLEIYQKIYNTYKTAINLMTVSWYVRSSAENEVIDHFKKNKNTIDNIYTVIKEFASKKISIITELKKPLVDFYKANSDEIVKLNAITATSDLDKNLKILENTRKYLEKNDKDIVTEIEQLKLSREALLIAVQKLKAKLPETAKKTEKLTYDSVIKFLKKDVPDYYDTTTTSIWNWYEGIISFFKETTEKVSWLSLYDVKEEFNNLKNSFLKNTEKLENTIKGTNKDTQAKEALKSAKKVFNNNDFLKSESKNTLEKVLETYKKKEILVETKAGLEIKKIESNLGTTNTKVEIKKAYTELKKYKNIFENKKSLIESIEKELIRKLLLNNVKSFKSELENITLSSDKKEVISQFLAWNISYNNKDLITMNVLEFQIMVQSNWLSYTRPWETAVTTVNLDDIKSLFLDGWAIYSSLQNL